MKDYLSYENARNKRNAALYERLLKRALGHDNVAILIGHHLTFEIDGDLSTENEIPSADTLMFDHDLMKAVFKTGAISLMALLARLTCDQRDIALTDALNQIEQQATLTS